MRTALRFLIGFTFFVLLGPAPASAQGYLAPSLGASFANPSAQGRANFVADLGWLQGNSPVGAELDVMYAPSFFGSEGTYGGNRVATVMGNMVLAGGGGFGRRGRSSVRPYLSTGVGLIHEVVNIPLISNSISNTDLGANVAVGVMARAPHSVGVKGEVRYFRDLINNQNGNATNIDFGGFHFWRASLGIILAF